MKSEDAARLRQLFALALAAADMACGASSSEPATPIGQAPTPTPSPGLVATLPPEMQAELLADAKTFSSVTLAQSPKKVLTVIDLGSEGMVCEPGPCLPAWLALEQGINQRGLVTEEAGVTKLVLEKDFAATFGSVDTAEKAALRVMVGSYTPALAKCSDFDKVGAQCADGSHADGYAVRAVEGGFDVALYGVTNVCWPGSFGNGEAFEVLHVASDGNLTPAKSALSITSKIVVGHQVSCHPVMLGRRFEGYVDLPPGEGELAYYVRAHHQESAAVVAFERLADELAAHDAPRELVSSARDAAEDERRHARFFQREAERLAAALGLDVGLVPLERPAPAPVRSLLAVLLENASEGCANETYAAAVATHQADFAPTPRLRALFRSIAADERKHAALSYRIHAWGRAVIGEGSRRLEQAYEASRETMATAEATPIGLAMGEPPALRARLAFEVVSRSLEASFG